MKGRGRKGREERKKKKEIEKEKTAKIIKCVPSQTKSQENPALPTPVLKQAQARQNALSSVRGVGIGNRGGGFCLEAADFRRRK